MTRRGAGVQAVSQGGSGDGMAKAKFSNYDSKDEPRSGRSATENVDVILVKVEQDRHSGSYDIAKELRIDHKTVMTHLQKLDIQIRSILGSHTSSLKEV
ncbi:hypothetical protein EVAR_86760_1 [Eumeta japonica]|uniref:Histone-lysine N-methyltransferase SETMAR n=1 Tax=Eumeta variegata TaxID=151549 RepID=A0A4C1W346_EUMVA|nr:hypothetical protein EVAR_86760_1 [Eumeta japonica]